MGNVQEKDAEGRRPKISKEEAAELRTMLDTEVGKVYRPGKGRKISAPELINIVS